MEKTIPEVMESIPRYFVPEKAAGVDAVIQFHLTGDQGGDWAVTIRNMQCSVVKGIAANPKLTFSAGGSGLPGYINGQARCDASLHVW